MCWMKVNENGKIHKKHIKILVYAHVANADEDDRKTRTKTIDNIHWRFHCQFKCPMQLKYLLLSFVSLLSLSSSLLHSHTLFSSVFKIRTFPATWNVICNLRPPFQTLSACAHAFILWLNSLVSIERSVTLHLKQCDIRTMPIWYPMCVCHTRRFPYFAFLFIY